MGQDITVAGAPAAWLRQFAGTSEMGSRVAELDWASTPLGPPETWSAELRAAVRMCLSTRFPVLVVAGPDMRKIYNDGYRDMLGSGKHPGALGAPAAEVWSEIWDIVGPLFDHVYETGEATWSQDERLVMDRNGYPEETYFTFSYSPVLDDDGRVSGVIDIAAETTSAVTTHEQLRCLTELGSAVVDSEDVTDICARAAAALSAWTSVVRTADVYLRVDDLLLLTASNRRGNDLAAAPTIDETALPRSARLPPGDRPVAEVAVPLGARHGHQAAGAMVLALNEQRPFDAEYSQFVELAANAVGAALDRAQRHAMEVDEYRRIGDTLQQAMLEPAADFETVAARYLPATGGLAVGGDWYDVVQLSDGRRGLFVGDCVGHGLDAAAAMSQLRAAARAMLLQGHDPAQTLEGLDVFARSIPDAFNTTAVCMVVDPRDGHLTYARAGHPYPLVVDATGVSWLDAAGGPPLGFAPEPGYTNATHELAPDDLIVLYTDGLIERRDESIDEGFARLERSVAGLRGEPVQRVPDVLLGDLLPDVPTDDVVVVVKRVPSDRSGGD